MSDDINKPGQSEDKDLSDLESDASVLREMFAEKFLEIRDSSAIHFYKEMSFFAKRFRVMHLGEFGQQKPEFDEDDSYAACELRKQLAVSLDVFAQSFAELMSWFVANLCRMQRQIDWLEHQSAMMSRRLEGEYSPWLQIACDGRAAAQDWRAPGWLNGWPEELSLKDLLAAARGGRLDATRTATVLRIIEKRIKKPMEQAHRVNLNSIRVQLAQKDADRQGQGKSAPAKSNEKSYSFNDPEQAVAKRSLLDSHLDVVKRRAILKQHPELSTKGLCELWENQSVPLPKNMKEAGTWPKAYRARAYRHRVESLASRDRKAVRE